MTFPTRGCIFPTSRENGGCDGGDPYGDDGGQVEVTLAVPPPIVVEEERRETGLPTSPSGGAHGSPAWSELEGSGGTAAEPE